MIADKAGIVARRHVTKENTSDLGAVAVNNLLSKANIDMMSIDALICATSSPDRIQPATATRIQHLCGLTRAFAFDINSVCSGGLFALKVASALTKDGCKNVIVVASEVYSKILNPRDITTFPYFGDGAGAVLVSDKGDYRIADISLYSDGAGADVIQVPAGGTNLPFSKISDAKDCFFKMNGKEVFKFATEKGSEVVSKLSFDNNVVPDCVITHQANLNIMKNIAEKTGIPFERFYVNVNRYANTAGASILIALDECLSNQQAPSNIFLVTFGGGLSWGGAYLEKC